MGMLLSILIGALAGSDLGHHRRCGWRFLGQLDFQHHRSSCQRFLLGTVAGGHCGCSGAALVGFFDQEEISPLYCKKKRSHRLRFFCYVLPLCAGLPLRVIDSLCVVESEICEEVRRSNPGVRHTQESQQPPFQEACSLDCFVPRNDAKRKQWSRFASLAAVSLIQWREARVGVGAKPRGTLFL